MLKLILDFLSSIMHFGNLILVASTAALAVAAPSVEKKKRAKKRSYIQSGSSLTVQRGLELVEIAKNGPIEEEAGPRVQQQPRAMRMCSLCRLTVHNARTCPERTQ